MGKKAICASKVKKRNKRCNSAVNRWKKMKFESHLCNDNAASETVKSMKSDITIGNEENFIDNARNVPCSTPLNKVIYSSSDGNIDIDNAWGSQEEYESILQHKLTIERVPNTPVLHGNRIVEINYVLNWAINLQYEHSKICTLGRLAPVREEKYALGLVSKIIFKCNMCDKEISHMTEDPNKQKSAINTGAVWGTLSTGSTYGHLEEFLSVMDIPSLSYYTFSKIEQDLAGIWKDELWNEMEKAGKEELQLAIDNKQLDSNNIPWIRVNVDGGWSKRSYGHNYDAASGVAVIIGNVTGKLLFVGVRNKYCSICARAANKKIPVGKHICFRNWSGSSSAMEADIVVEGFNQSEELHGLRFLEFIADGDSSVYSKIKEKVNYGRHVIKIECANHCIKNYGKYLYKIKEDKAIDVVGRKWLTTDKIKQFQKIAQLSIYHHEKGDVEILKKDLQSGQLHIFDDHTCCKTYFCNQIGQCSSASVRNNSIFLHVSGALNGLIKHSAKLIANETNNKAECFMSVLARFNAGKRLNLTQRGSFQLRTYLTGLRYNNSFSWHTGAWKRATERSPGRNFKKFISRKYRNKIVCRKLIYNSNSKLKVILPNIDYGPKCAKPDLSISELKSEEKRILQNLQITPEQQLEICTNTVGQFGNARYEFEKKNRLTASNFGAVIRRRQKTPCHNLIKKLLFTTNFTSPAINYGKIREPVAIKTFESKTGLKVQPSGLFVDTEYGFLGASPDGIIDSEHIIEVKCLYSLCNLQTSILDAVKRKKNICLVEINNQLKLKKSHPYFYQIQGQLHISRRKYCYFIVYANDNIELFIQKIERDENFWQTYMLPKLIDFYNNCMLPEIADSRISRGLICRDNIQKT